MTHFNTYNAASKNFNIGGRQNGHTDGRTDGRTDGQTDRNRYYIGSLLLRSSPKKKDLGKKSKTVGDPKSLHLKFKL